MRKKINFFNGSALTFLKKYATMIKNVRKKAMSLHDGHRKRLIERLFKDENSIKEHEFLELLLFFAIPRRDTNDIAHRLLDKFGSIPQVLSASIADLKTVEGVGESVAVFLRSMGIMQNKYFPAHMHIYHGKYDEEQFHSYVKSYYYREMDEVFDVYFLEENGNVNGLQRFTLQSEKMVQFVSRDLAELLVRIKTAGIIIVHNHPNGFSDPSYADRLATERCHAVCDAHNVLLCDHIIYGRDGVYSFANAGDLKNPDFKYEEFWLDE